jgi:hypothetical protein
VAQDTLLPLSPLMGKLVKNFKEFKYFFAIPDKPVAPLMQRHKLVGILISYSKSGYQLQMQIIFRCCHTLGLWICRLLLCERAVPTSGYSEITGYQVALCYHTIFYL